MNCKSCGTELPPTSESPFCKTECKVQYINDLILMVQPNLTGSESSEDMGVINAESRVGMTRAVRYMTPEGILSLHDLLVNLASECRMLVFTHMSRNAVLAQTQRDLESRTSTNKRIIERDSALVKNAVSMRQEDIEKRNLKSSGAKISKTGKCANCDRASIAECCSPICKGRWAVIKSQMSIFKITEAEARKRVAKMTGLDDMLVEAPEPNTDSTEETIQ